MSGFLGDSSIIQSKLSALKKPSAKLWCRKPLLDASSMLLRCPSLQNHVLNKPILFIVTRSDVQSISTEDRDKVLKQHLCINSCTILIIKT